MKSYHFILSLIAVGSALVGAGVALTYQPEARSTPPEMGSSPEVAFPQASPSPGLSGSRPLAIDRLFGASPPPVKSVVEVAAPPSSQQEPIAAETQKQSVSQAVAPTQRQPLRLRDAVSPGSDFAQFRQRLRRAVRDRDADFVGRLIPPEGISFGFSVPRSAASLRQELTNPEARLWPLLEKALAPGCDPIASEEFPADSTETWICHNLSRLFDEQYPDPSGEPGLEYLISRVMVIGDAVNVRAEPRLNSTVVGQLSNEVVKFDRQAWDKVPPEERAVQEFDLDSWIPILLPSGQPGYVSNRYAYFPLGNRVVLGRIEGNWQILRVLAGD